MKFHSQHNTIYWMISVNFIQRIQGIVDRKVSIGVDRKLTHMRAQIDEVANRTRSLVIESMRNVYDELNSNR
jgi:nitrogen-specific signal transduction histidine kinase